MRDLETGTLEIDGKTCNDCNECAGINEHGMATCMLYFLDARPSWLISIEDPACRRFKPRPVDMTMGAR